MNEHTNNSNGETGADAGTLRIGLMLDALAVRDRAAAPPGMEERVAGAAIDALDAARRQRGIVGAVGPAPRTAGVPAGLRLAAAVAILATAGAAWLAQRSPAERALPVAQQTPESEAAVLAAIWESEADEGDLESEVARVDQLIENGWDTSVFEGAM